MAKDIIIKKIIPETIAQEVGIEAGDRLISINGESVKDIFDYKFLTVEEELIVEIQKPDGEIWEIEIEKDENEELGLEFEDFLMDNMKGCKNKCIFCFVDQLPKNLRKTLYFKDDDFRLSFLTGNYVTLTNTTREDIDRIIKYKMTPINVSVHTTDPEIRIFMLNNKNAGDIMDKMKLLVGGGIDLNCQIVLCKDINDGQNLTKTINDLVNLYPKVRSISVVPIGITRYREKLTSLSLYDENSSKEVIFQVEDIQKQHLKKYKSRIVYCADEFYTKANIEIPNYEEYEEFLQLENGVGFIALFKKEFYNYIGILNYKLKKDRKISIATGVSAYKYINELVLELESRYKNLKINLYRIVNDFFGESVTVTGLLTGGDLLKALKDKDLGEELLICECMLKSAETVFLDDYSVEMLERDLGTTVTVVPNDGKIFIRKVLGMEG